MKLYHQPSGLQHGLDLLINPHWSPDQAMAVIELGQAVAAALNPIKPLTEPKSPD